MSDEFIGQPVGAMTQHTGTNPQPFGYAGQQQDVSAEGGLVYLRARYYDPALGRFLTQDPVRSPQRYSYAGDDPENYFDPTGRFGCGPFGKACSAVENAGGDALSVAQAAAYVPLELASVDVYAQYYASYHALRAIGSLPPPVRTAIASNPAAQGVLALLWSEQAYGLGADASIDVIKNEVLCNNEKVGDEGLPGYLLGTRLGSWVDAHFGLNTRIYLPGIHNSGQVDWAWGTP